MQLSRKTIAAGVYSIVVATLLLAASRADWLPDAQDRFTYDWRTYLFTERASEPVKDIVLLLINEKSLKGYPYLSPIDRGLLADLVTAIDATGPKAIGLDIILDRPTEAAKDVKLISALRNAKTKVILGALDSRGASVESLSEQEAFLSAIGRPAGHLFFATEENLLTLGDQAVRFMLPADSRPPSRPAFSQLLAEVDGEKLKPSSNLIFWRHPPAMGGADLFQRFTVEAHRDRNGSTLGTILPDAWKGAFAGKIVLIGGAFSDRDRHLTPLSIATGARIPGIQVHAQILAQLREGKSVFTMHWAVELFAVAAVAGLGFFSARRWRLSGDGWRTSFLALLALVALGIGFFWAFRLILPSATLSYAWLLGLLGGNRADWASAHWARLFCPSKPAA